jgi:lipoprotein-anchoring transpeptidase ErfK/SrfK
VIAPARICGLGVLAVTVGLLAACTGQSAAHQTTPATTVPPSPTANSTSATATVATPGPTSSGPRKGSGAPVHVSLWEGDGQTFGIAMPIIAFFSATVTDASAFDQVTRVTVNGAPAHGAWYWEPSSRSNEAMEAHYRLTRYWPAHATIRLSLPTAGLWAGPGRVFGNSLTLTMHTGAAHIVKIDGRPGVDRMVAYSDGKLVRRVAVSLGAAQTPTYLGTAVALAKSNPQLMVSAPGEPFYSIEVPWSVRMTYDGEFLHDAYWNNQLGQVNLSHGCTNMSPADAEWYYHWSLIGDPVTWTNTGTSKVMPVTDGWGDWNLPFATYARGGLLAR